MRNARRTARFARGRSSPRRDLRPPLAVPVRERAERASTPARITHHALRALPAALLVVALGARTRLDAQVSACAPAAPVAAHAWPAPLDRRVALQARGVSLRDALD